MSNSDTSLSNWVWWYLIKLFVIFLITVTLAAKLSYSGYSVIGLSNLKFGKDSRSVKKNLPSESCTKLLVLSKVGYSFIHERIVYYT